MDERTNISEKEDLLLTNSVSNNSVCCISRDLLIVACRQLNLLAIRLLLMYLGGIWPTVDTAERQTKLRIFLNHMRQWYPGLRLVDVKIAIEQLLQLEVNEITIFRNINLHYDDYRNIWGVIYEPWNHAIEPFLFLKKEDIESKKVSGYIKVKFETVSNMNQSELKLYLILKCKDNPKHIYYMPLDVVYTVLGWEYVEKNVNPQKINANMQRIVKRINRRGNNISFNNYQRRNEKKAILFYINFGVVNDNVELPF